MEVTDLTELPFKMPFTFHRLKLHYASYEPTIRVLLEKHHTLLKQKTLASMERDRAVEQVKRLSKVPQTDFYPFIFYNKIRNKFEKF